MVVGALGLLLWGQTPAHAGERSTGSWSLQAPSEADWPWRIYAGLASGYGLVSGSEFARAPGGETVGLGLAVSYESSRWIAETGLSWFYSHDSGIAAAGHDVDLKTRMGVIDFGARARFGPFWQVGPEFKITYGTDTSFGPSVSPTHGANAFAGARVAYENHFRIFPYRLYAEASRSVTIADRVAYFALAGVQIGLPVGVRRTGNDIVTSTNAAPSRPPEIRVVLDPEKVFFSKMSAEIRPKVSGMLSEVAKFLAANDAGWEEVEISGHTDRRGRFEYNLELSRKRALAVKGALLNGGVNDEKLRTEAYGYLKPALPGTGPAVWAKNRRVEIVIRNVKNPGEFREKIRGLENIGETEDEHH